MSFLLHCLQHAIVTQSPLNQSHPSIDAIVHDILAAQRSTGTTYALFTDGSFQLGDLPTGLILESEHMRRSYGNASAAIIAVGPLTT